MLWGTMLDSFISEYAGLKFREEQMAESMNYCLNMVVYGRP